VASRESEVDRRRPRESDAGQGSGRLGESETGSGDDRRCRGQPGMGRWRLSRAAAEQGVGGRAG
jgi:hypothetical protein